MLRGCLVCVICNSYSIHSFIFKLYIIIVHTFKMCPFYYTHFMNIALFGGGGGGLNLRHFLEMLRWFLVCVICNSKSFHSSIFKLCLMIINTLNICLPFLCKFHKMLRGSFVCVICNSSSIQNFCIMIVHILSMYTLYLRTFDNIFLSV